MNVTHTSVDALKRRAKLQSKSNKTSYKFELNNAAQSEGFESWQLYMRQVTKARRRAHNPILFDKLCICFDTLKKQAPGTVVLQIRTRNGNLVLPLYGQLIYVLKGEKYYIAADLCVDISHSATLPRDEAIACLQNAITRGESYVVPKNFPLVTQLRHFGAYDQFLGTSGPWVAEQVMRTVSDLTYAKATGHRPAWFLPQHHAQLFSNTSEIALAKCETDYDYTNSIFTGGWFRRACEADKLVYRLSCIQPGKNDAYVFQEWVAGALATLFPQGLRNIELNPNGKGPARRDIVATNTEQGTFWFRIGQDYGSRTVVFEVKNFSEPRSADFQQLRAYLNDPHYGDIGFLVTHATTFELSQSTWGHVRHAYKSMKDSKILLLLPSSFLEQLLRWVWTGKASRIDDAMVDLLDVALRRHLIN